MVVEMKNAIVLPFNRRLSPFKLTGRVPQTDTATTPNENALEVAAKMPVDDIMSVSTMAPSLDMHVSSQSSPSLVAPTPSHIAFSVALISNYTIAMSESMSDSSFSRIPTLSIAEALHLAASLAPGEHVRVHLSRVVPISFAPVFHASYRYNGAWLLLVSLISLVSENARLILVDSSDGSTCSVLLSPLFSNEFASDIYSAMELKQALSLHFLSISNTDLRAGDHTKPHRTEEHVTMHWATASLEQLSPEAVQANSALLRGIIYQHDRPVTVALVRKYSTVVYALKANHHVLVEPLRQTKKFKSWARLDIKFLHL